MSEISRQNHEAARPARAKDFDIIACGPSGCRHAAPLPGPDTLAETYRETYRSAENPTYLARSAEGQVLGIGRETVLIAVKP